MTISLVPNYIGALSKQLFSLFLFSLLILPLLHAFSPSKCSSSNYYFGSLRCDQQSGVSISFPFCDYPGFNFQCTNLNKTVIEFPMFGTFLVDRINYAKQQISISDPENCMVRRLLTFNISGTPFSYHNNIQYTFLACPLEVKGVFRYYQIPCLSNSTTSFIATSNSTLAESMLPSCQIVKRLFVPVVVEFQDYRFSSYVEFQDLLLDWNSPDCRACVKESLRCGFRNKGSLDVKCFDDYKSGSGQLSSISVLIIALCTIGGTTIFACIAMTVKYRSEGLTFQRRQNTAITARGLTQQPNGVAVTRGLDHDTIESYKKVELGESRRLPGTNGIICPICLSEYASKETVRCIPECEHCFHVECIDAWLNIHNLCPICRNSRS